MKEKNAGKIYNLIVSVAAIACMWLVWLIAWIVVDDGYVVPSVGDSLSQFFSLLGTATFWSAFGMTLLRTAYSWLAAAALAAVFASFSAVFKGARAFIAPFIAVFRTVPTMAITLMLLIWASPRVAPSIVTVLMVFPLSYAQMMAAFDGTDRGLAEMARVYRVPLSARLFKIYVPQILPPVLAQAGANFSLALKVMISAEVLCSTFNSLGGLIYQANVNLNTALMFALTLTALVTGGLFEWGLSRLVRITDKWTGKSAASNGSVPYKGGVPRCRMLACRTRYCYRKKLRFGGRGSRTGVQIDRV